MRFHGLGIVVADPRAAPVGVPLVAHALQYVEGLVAPYAGSLGILVSEDGPDDRFKFGGAEKKVESSIPFVESLSAASTRC